MCGINGFNFENRNLLERMNKATRHRGPDGEGSFVDHVSLGHNRLAIIDLSEKGKQPMSNRNGTIWITFNGEIYNFQELRLQLEKKYRFNSNSDTEVIIHAYEEWGSECVQKFNGMWAFCIYDKRKNIFFLSRDRLGKKPLHYYSKSGKFIFSSEIKGLLEHGIEKRLNLGAISSYLSYRYVLGEETFFEDIYKLLPGHNLFFDLNTHSLRKEEYWDLQPHKSDVTESQAQKALDNLLKESVAYRKISDVSLGVILSGGLDSSLITALLAQQEKKPISTFTVAFKEEGYDESKFAREVATLYGANCFEVGIDTSNFLTIMKEYASYKDEPIGIPNEIALYILAKKIKEQVTVVLSGEGADEIFEGYSRKFTSARDYEILKRLQQLPDGHSVYKNQFSELFKKYRGRFFDSEMEHFLSEYKYWTEEDKARVLTPEANTANVALFAEYFNKYDMPYEKKIAYIFTKLHLPGLLNRLDSATMASAIEARAPFLDYKVAEYAFSLPEDLKLHWNLSEHDKRQLNENADDLADKANTAKYILKEVGRKYLPDLIVDREKQGFPLPLSEWFATDFKNVAHQILLNPRAKIRRFVDQIKLKEWLESDPNGKRFGQKIWMLLSLELWLEAWLIDG